MLSQDLLAQASALEAAASEFDSAPFQELLEGLMTASEAVGSSLEWFEHRVPV